MPAPKAPRQCGTWPSSISAMICAAFPEGPSSAAMFEPQTKGNAIYWLSARPTEHGRNTIMRWPVAGAPEEILPSPWDARTKVHEYGGGAYLPTEHALVFSHYTDDRLYIQDDDGATRALTSVGPFRYADLEFDKLRNRIICVRENVSGVSSDGLGPRADLVAIALASGETTVLVTGWDFLSNPQLSPDGSNLCWLCWNHPNMPWDSTLLCRATIRPDGGLNDHQSEESEGQQSRLQPRWSPSGELYFVSDRDDWWNLYHWPHCGPVTQITTIDGEVGAPPWFLGQSHWRFIDENTIVLIYASNGYWHAARVQLPSGRILDCSRPHAFLGSVVTAEGRAFITGSDEHGASGLYEYSNGELRLLVSSRNPTLERVVSEPSVAQALTIPIGDASAANGEFCYCWFYAPTNPNYCPLPGEKPPAIVELHGGPTTASWSMLKLSRQFWTSRGFAVLDVNYRGSSGRGRKYRNRLYGGWGLVDVEDALSTLRHAAALGLIDGTRTLITGASAGGFTTLATLTSSNEFSGGINIFGVSDLTDFNTSTHKFERYYLRSLIGEHANESAALKRRSPIEHIDRLSVPLLTLQGAEDKIVTPPQSSVIMAALRAMGIPCAYLEFADEGHGFRKVETLSRVLEASLSFCAQVFDLPISDNIPPLDVENLHTQRVRGN